MNVSDDLDPDTVDKLAMQFAAIVNKDIEVLTHREILSAFMLSIASTLAAIPCPGCREQSARSVQAEFRDIVSKALEKAVERFGNQPSGHLH